MREDELAAEQAYVDRLYAQLDVDRAGAEEQAARAAAVPAQSGRELLERDAAVTAARTRRAALAAAEEGLCFGRIDTADGRRHYIGRVGLRDGRAEEPLLLDWRAPAARPFYVATPASPEGLVRRRSITTRGRRVTHVNDELLDVDRAAGTGDELVGEAALLAAVTSTRTGRMRDIVATMQREQDEAVRSEHSGALVVQGGPGTGKTAVALHRAAYLLYTRPELAHRGVLVVGPSPAFLAYVSDVLPGLGESNAVLATVASLFPGVSAVDEHPSVAEVKGRPAMADVVAAAVRGHEGAGHTVRIEHEGDELTLSARFLADAVAAARGTGVPHNEARRVFRRHVLAELARQSAQARRSRLEAVEAGLEAELAAIDRLVAADLARLPALPDVEEHATERPSRDELVQLTRELAAAPQVRAAIHRLWPVLTPQQLLEDLFADAGRLAAAAGSLRARDRELLARPPGSRWTAADVPLLDEAAELLGEDTQARQALADRNREREVAYARGVLQIAGSGPLDDDTVLLSPADAEQLAERHAEQDLRTLAERAAADRTWAYGHVVVDEAQELSPMAWRLLLRRCPTRSFTLVGDLAQAHAPGAPATWEEALTPHFGSRWREARLSVNYRTPRETMDVAVGVLAAAGHEALAPRSIRSSGNPPWRQEHPAERLPAAAAAWAAAGGRRAGGTCAVIVADELAEQVAAAVVATV
ncbi:HelD family protein, partial [Motilibacter deserti]